MLFTQLMWKAKRKRDTSGERKTKRNFIYFPTRQLFNIKSISSELGVLISSPVV